MSTPETRQPTLLALDTATDRLYLALRVGEQVHARDLPGGAQASATLLPALEGLLTEAGLAWPQVDALAFGRGPGAFTGLRTACSVTQGLALALDKPVIALDTLMAVAEHARLRDPAAWHPGDTVWVLQDARMDELYVAAYQWDGACWQAVQAPQLWSLDEPARRWSDSPAWRWVGNALRAYPAPLACLAACPSPQGDEPAVPGGAALAELAAQAWQRGDLLDAALALPLYVRDKVAQTTAERRSVGLRA